MGGGEAKQGHHMSSFEYLPASYSRHGKAGKSYGRRYSEPARLWFWIAMAFSIFSIMNTGFAGDQPGLITSEFIFETAPFPSCHASTIAETTGGGLVAAWFGGAHEKAPD